MFRLSSVRVLAATLLLATGWAAAEVRVRVTDQTLGPVDRRVFGQFLERASWGEPGPEAFVDAATGRLPTNIVALLKEMRIPVIRFPGGSDVDRIDWTDMIDNVPGRQGTRPVTKVTTNQITNRFGYDEFFALRRELGCEAVIVLNVADVLAKRRSVLDTAGLVAYCNAPLGAKLPAGMPDWPAVRARNGHAAPFRVEYFQLGNEWFLFRQAHGIKVEASACLPVLHELIRTIRAIDPAAQLILDGNMGGAEEPVLRDPVVREAVRYVTFHHYAPGPVGPVRRDGREVAAATLSVADWWYACATMPQYPTPPAFARALGYRLACTEWNWNGWGFKEAPAAFRAEHLGDAKALGVAGFLHGMMRGGVELATQSMLLGSRWDIAAVRGDPTGKTAPRFSPQGGATAFYAQHHGNRLLAIEHAPLTAHAQPFIVGRWTRWPETMPVTVAHLDLLVTADDQRVYVHALNRHFTDAQSLQVDLTALGIADAVAQHHRPDAATAPVETKAGVLTAPLPPRSINIVEVPRP